MGRERLCAGEHLRPGQGPRRRRIQVSPGPRFRAHRRRQGDHLSAQGLRAFGPGDGLAGAPSRGWRQAHCDGAGTRRFVERSAGSGRHPHPVHPGRHGQPVRHHLVPRRRGDGGGPDHRAWIAADVRLGCGPPGPAAGAVRERLPAWQPPDSDPGQGGVVVEAHGPDGGRRAPAAPDVPGLLRP